MQPIDDNQVLKQCKDCQEFYPRSEFHANRRTRDRLHIYCKSCAQIRYRLWVENNQRPQDQDNARQRSHVRKVKGFLDSVRSSSPCCICGEREICCLDFHHIDQNGKQHTLSAVKSMPIAIAELKKCTVLCRNCHAKVHGRVIDGSALKPIPEETVEDLINQFARTLLYRDL